jgi:hypothetical protein
MIIDLREIPVVWINLDSATKNAEIMEERFKKYGFKNTHRRSGLIIPPPPGTHQSIAHFMGCGKTHTGILEDKSYSTPLLVLEDDIEFCDNFNPVIEVPDDADGVYLGISHGNMYYKSAKYNEQYLRIAGILAAHAILYLTDDFRENMARVGNYCMDELKQPWDMGSSAIQHTFKVVTPLSPVVYQSNDRENANKWQNLTDHPLQNRESVFDDNL